MEQFDKLMKEMAEKEEIIVPNGFDERVQGALEELPHKQKKHRLGAVKTALIAAAACLLLVGTALAASPELWGMLADALGSFAPYATEQEDQIYTVDGFELKVLSTLTDGFVIQAYVQVKDLEGHRLSADMAPFGFINFVDVNAQRPVTTVQYGPSSAWRYAIYDEETETALMVFTDWGEYFADLSTATLYIFNIYDFDFDQGTVSPQLSIPLTAEAADKLTFDEDSELARYLGAKRVELSPLGLTAIFEYDRTGEPADPLEELMDKVMDKELMETNDINHVQPVRVRMKDGTELYRIVEHNPLPTREASYSDRTKDFYGVIRSWNFTDAIDLKQVEGIFMYGRYFPVN